MTMGQFIPRSRVTYGFDKLPDATVDQYWR